MPYASRFLRALFIVTTMVGFSVSAPAAAPPPEIPDAWPKWLQDGMAEEARKKRKSSVEVGGMTLRYRGEQAAEPIEVDNGWVIQVDVGAETPVYCWVYPGGAVLGRSTLITHNDSVAETLSHYENGTLDKQTLYYLDSGFFKEAPYIAFEYIYTWKADDTEDTFLRLSKLRSAQRGDATFNCLHDEIGYHKTFSRFFEYLITKSEIPEPDRNVVYREGFDVTMGDRPAGVEYAQFSVDEDGDTRIDTVSTTMIQVDANTVVISDNHRREFSEPDGTLINTYVWSYENGEQQVNLHLKWEDAWVVEGTFRGKDLKLTLDLDEDPLTTKGIVERLSQLIADKSVDELTVPFWMPDVDPSIFTPIATTIEKRGRKATAMSTMIGPLVIRSNSAPDGTTLNAVFEVGPITLNMERVYSDGKIK